MELAAADTRAARVERRFDKPLLLAAVLSIPATILQTTHATEPWGTIGYVLNWAIWTMFLVELVVMLAIVPNRRQYLRHHPLELIIVVLTPPFFLNAVQGIRFLRLFRLLRLLRLAPLVRVLFSTEGVQAAGVLALLTALAGGGGFATIENLSFGNGVYWAIATMTTVGYGDITPHSAEGKVLAVVVMLVGIGTATLVIGAVARRFISPGVHEVEAGEEDLLVQVEDISVRLGRLETALRQRARETSDA
jgi:voltage-gated potassium channel